MNPRTIVSRRRALGLLGAAGAALTGACGGDTPTSPTSTSTTTSTTTTTGVTSGTAGACAASPNETVGPFPSLSQFVRSDIREDRPGLPLDLTLRS